MNQLPSSNTANQEIELKFFQDWKKSYALIVQAIKEAPIASAIVVTTAAISITYPQLLVPCLLIQTISWFFLSAKLMRVTYCEIMPQAQGHPELFQKRPEFQLFVAQWLFNVGTMVCALLFILPGFWFALVHLLAQQLVVLENLPAEPAFKRSRQLMKGNISKTLGYVVLWPLLGMIVTFVGLGLGVGFVVGIIKIATQVDHMKTAAFLLKAFFTYLGLSVQLSCTTLMVRAYVQFTHKSGSLTAIEKQLNPEIAMQ